MLESVKISRRQSEIRQALAGLVAKATPTDDETKAMENMDLEYRSNETRFRASLISEDTERRDAKGELETRADKDWTDLVQKFELRQVALMLDEGRALDGPTAEIVTEMRGRGGYRGVPVPWAALETRAGETIAAGVPNPRRVAPIIDRIFADSAAARMGAQIVNVGVGELDYPVVSSSITAGWAPTETGNVAGPTVFSTTDQPLAPDHTLGIQVRVTRKALKQAGDALEQAIRRDLNGAINEKIDEAVFLGTGAGGQPTGIIVGAAAFGITVTPIGAAASWAAFRGAVARFLTANSAKGPDAVNLLMRPEIWAAMDGALIAGTAVSEWDRLAKNIPAENIVMSSNALAAPAGSPAASTAVLTTTVNGIPPIFIGTWGGLDIIRDPFTDAQSGGLRLTALATVDVTISRASQIEILTGIR